MRPLLAPLFVLLAFGCSVLDPGDRDELRSQIAMLPPEGASFMTRTVMNSKALDWLHGRPPNDQVGKLQCRLQAGGQWTDWADQEPTYTVDDLKDCLLYSSGGTPVTYTMCLDFFLGRDGTAKEHEILDEQQVPGVTNVECRFVWDWRYEPEKVPRKLTDPSAITADDTINCLIGLPAPPPGWAFPELVPLLCPLGAGPGWGCPPRPTDPTGGQPTDPTGGGTGDQP
jgi:hypothetical protein